MVKIQTVSDIVDRLGGRLAVAQYLKVSYAQVSNMIQADAIPPKHYFAISDKLNGAVPRKLFRPARATG